VRLFPGTEISAGRASGLETFEKCPFLSFQLDPESRNLLIILDSRFHGNDNMEAGT